jgi:hypothetical protein
MQKLTKEQAIVITGFTGFMACSFSNFHEDVEKRFGRPVFTHEFGDKDFAEKLKEKYRADFLSMVVDEKKEDLKQVPIPGGWL